jgi:hypothetical protein
VVFADLAPPPTRGAWLGALGMPSLLEAAAFAPQPCRLGSLAVQLTLPETRALLFAATKHALFAELLSATTTPTRLDDPYEDPPSLLTVSLHRLRASKARETGTPAQRERHSLVVQGAEALARVHPQHLRRAVVRALDDGQERTFKVKFVGEGVYDNGGPYREIFNDWAAELMSDALPLFTRSPNARADVGSGRDCWVVNPSCERLDLYRFVGQLIGMALRGRVLLGLSLAPSFWKALTREPATLADLEAQDAGAAQLLRDLVRWARGELPADWSPGVERFTALLSDGVTVVELCAGGAARALTRENAAEYAALCLKRRLGEAQAQMQAVAEGLASIVPTNLNALFTASEFETLVCGRPDYDVAQLQAITVYEGSTQPSQPHIRAFWQVLSEFTPEQRARFLRFAWARTRLPRSVKELHTRFKLQDPKPYMLSDPDRHFPTANTCFFTLSLPPYTNAQTLRAKLLYAMDTCQTMNLDMVLQSSELYDHNADDLG